MKQNFTLPENYGKNARVDKYFAELLPQYSRAALTKLFELNLIKLNGEPIKPGHKVKPGQTIEYDLGPLQEQPEVIDLPIIYEDENVVVVNKPAGIISHARGRFWQEASVASFIRSKVQNSANKSNLKDEVEVAENSQISNIKYQISGSERAGIVHRLDRATSGVIITAKNEKTLKFLQKQFEDRKVKKTYLALVEKAPKENEFIIDAPIARKASDPKRFEVSPHGKPAQTNVQILCSNEKKTLLKLTPATGRTHQLRVHLDYIGRSIIGDPLYGEKSKQHNEHSNSLRLHSWKLNIKITDEKEMEFVAAVPKYWSLNAQELEALK